MTLNCMNCRANSKLNKNKFEKPPLANATLRVKILTERNWSGTLIPPAYTQEATMELNSIPTKKPKRAYRRYGSIGAIPIPEEDAVDLLNEPRLMRSGGIRRDWSFEDLGASKRDAKRKPVIC